MKIDIKKADRETFHNRGIDIIFEILEIDPQGKYSQKKKKILKSPFIKFKQNIHCLAIQFLGELHNTMLKDYAHPSFKFILNIFNLVCFIAAFVKTYVGLFS